MKAVIVLMGVSGSGKTTVGKCLAERLNCPFYDGDDFHPPENVVKMAGGIPLDDDDRAPWLARLHDLLAGHAAKSEPAVVACSALKRIYREQLRAGIEDIRFVYLRGTFETLWTRLQARENHYMKAEMLRSQFDTLEPPLEDEAIIIDVDSEVQTVISSLQAVL